MGCSPIDRVAARLERKHGNQLYLRGEYQQAIPHYDAALRRVPALVEAHLARAYSHEALLRSNTDAAERRRLAGEAVHSYEAYLDAVEPGADAGPQPPSRDDIEQHIVTLYLDSQQTDAAVQVLEARLQRDPHDAATMQMLSHIDAEAGRVDDAMRWQRRRVEAQPDSPEAREALGAFVWQMSYRDPSMDEARRAALLDEGLAAVEKAAALRPEYFDALLYTNLLYLEKAKYAKDDGERQKFQSRAKAFRERALALRKETAQQAAPGPGS